MHISGRGSGQDWAPNGSSGAVAEQAVVGIRVLESRETPGLGDRIETDPDFLANFERLDVSLDADGARPLHPIEAVKQGQKEHAWQVDGWWWAEMYVQARQHSRNRSSRVY